MRFNNLNIIKLSLVLIGFSATSVLAKDYVVDTQSAYNAIASKLEAGDNVILQNGTYTDFEILLKGQGTKEQPITLTAQTKGKVVLTGQSNLRLAGQYLHASGLIFKDGYTPSSAVIAFRQNKQNLAFHSRVSEMVIDNYNNPDKRESDYWVALYGQHNRFDHNHLVGKRNKGVTLAVRLDSEQSQENYHRIDHNYFGYRPTFGSNGGETIRIGTSHYSLTDSHTLVESNYFEQTNGEVEIISVKSGHNTLRNNVFYEARGTLTLRHGNHNVIEENIFLGNGVEHTGGIRVINKHQTVRNNYLQGLTGYRFGSGFTVMNGVPNSPINRYHQVDGALIENNTFVNVRHIQLGAGSDAERSAVPINSTMRNNLVVNDNGQQPFTIFDDVKGIEFANNVANTRVAKEVAGGFSTRKVALENSENGLLVPSAKAIKVGAKADLSVLDKAQTGVTWYPKVPAVIAFDSGNTIKVDASPRALLEAIEKAQDGDILTLSPGQYDVSKLVIIDKTLTIKAKPNTANITFARSTLFELHDGGSLKLDGVNVSGQSSPDSAGNSVVRTKKWGMVENYRLVVQNSVFTDLNINHTFNFFTSGKGALADQITLTNNTFENVSGDILKLDKEIEDLGVYNAEYVTLENNRFDQVAGALVTLYRGGTDESTFGPHFLMQNNTVKHAGKGKRNKRSGSIYLHGVQVSQLENNTFSHSAPIVVEHTVGEPKTAIVNNTFVATAQPQVSELHVEGPHTAVLKNNNSSNEASEE